jgi:serine/threonine-protein kinase
MTIDDGLIESTGRIDMGAPSSSEFESTPTEAMPADKAAAAGQARTSAQKSAPTHAKPAAASRPDMFAQDKMLGEFRLLRRLGRGGMAEVYLAEQISLKRNVAVKVLRSDLVADAHYLQRFKTEAHAAAGLNHPNIVQVYTVGEAEGVHYIAQEYVQGMNLREFLVRKGPPDFAVALRIMRQVASALQVAGAAGIIHRDIKPENIMLTRKGEVKVADFGLAKVTQAGEPVNLTQVGTTMGTPLYMSPEQVNGGVLDQRSDIYSFGVTCYHMLSGSPPFRGETAVSVAVQHLRDEAQPLEELRPDLPPLLCRVVHKMMAKEVQKRYSSAAALLKDLKRLGQEQTHKDSQPTHEPDAAPAPGAVPAGRRFQALRRLGAGLASLADLPARRQVPRLLGACLLLAGVAAGLGWVLRPSNPLAAPVVSHGDEVPRKGSAAEQYRFAAALKTNEAAWKAVIENYPNEPFYKLRADLELALLYLKDGRRPGDAAAIFKELATYDYEPTSQAAGLAGLATVLSLQRQAEESQRILQQLQPLRGRLDGRMLDLVRRDLARNQEALKSQEAKDLQKLFEQPSE